MPSAEIFYFSIRENNKVMKTANTLSNIMKPSMTIWNTISKERCLIVYATMWDNVPYDVSPANLHQPAHPYSLIKVHIKKPWISGFP